MPRPNCAAQWPAKRSTSSLFFFSTLLFLWPAVPAKHSRQPSSNVEAAQRVPWIGLQSVLGRVSVRVMAKEGKRALQLPKQQLLILAICRFAEPVAMTSVYPYIVSPLFID